MVKINMRKAVALIISIVLLLSTGCSHLEALFTDDSYKDLLFNPGFVHSIDIHLDGDDWTEIHEEPMSGYTYEANITIDDEYTRRVGFSTKDDDPVLQQVVESGSGKFSYDIDFDGFIDGQSWHGLDQFCLLNMYGDATCMKDYITYNMFRRVGVPSPLASYVWLKVNGEIQGLYLAVEDINVSFINRCFDGEGSLYRPEKAFSPVVSDVKGADLVFRGNAPEFYSDIFDHDILIQDTRSRDRVIKCLQKIQQNDDLENALDTDELIAYFTVNNFVVNYDSYTGELIHNFYLYEDDGCLAMIPWDYDQIFGSFPDDYTLCQNQSSKIINQGIDSPLDNRFSDSRPMWGWIVSNDEYLNKYHETMGVLIEEYFDSGEFEAETSAVYDMILPYVQCDPASFCTVNCFDSAFHMFRRAALLRSVSVKRQLEGSLATVTDEQKKEDRVDVSPISLADFTH